MRARLNIRLLSLAIAVTGLLALPTAAMAYAPAGPDFISCTPADPAPGEAVTCTGGLFDPGTEVEVTIDGVVTTVIADENGEISFDLDAPADGDISISLSGTRDGVASSVADADAAVVTETDDLADTGSDAGLLAIVAFGAIAVGGGALVASRRQRATTAA